MSVNTEMLKKKSQQTIFGNNFNSKLNTSRPEDLVVNWSVGQGRTVSPCI